MKHKILFIAFVLCVSGTFAQSVDDIKNNRMYLWGEGNGVTLNEADKNALSMLINQISVDVESKFELEKTENDAGQISEQVISIVNTYSSASLHNTERIVVNQEPAAKVLRYIKRTDVSKIFKNRELKIKEFCDYAHHALEEVRISDAIKYYYWAHVLLRSHPDQSKITYMDNMGKEHLLCIWLPRRIKQILSGIDINIKNKEVQKDHAVYKLYITYKDKPVEKFVYQYWTGQDYTNLIEASDGLGIAEFFGKDAKGMEKIQIKTEYIFKNESLYDKELNTVMEKIPDIPIKEAYFNLNLASTTEQETTHDEHDGSVTTNTSSQDKKESCTKMSLVNDISGYTEVIEPVMDAIASQQYTAAKPYFTARGYEIYEKLIKYGNAKILDQPELTGMKKDNKIIIRAIPMLFSFKTNNRKFVENVVFHFDDNNKICDLSFSLSETALNDVLKKDQWRETDRMTIIDFLEHYKTAYALERIEYIESIFSDDALIITGAYKTVPSLENPYKNNKILQYNRYNKQEYINRLKVLFNSKEYINLQFEKSDIRAGDKDHVYGIQIKQNYYSSNYGDKGYLFLMVDLQDTSKPTIHVRTWQPNKDEKGNIYGIEDF
ncbi:MAG: LPP20 family lipoprotein [Candidatus Delongbacteria bacterium]|nr:LPP20 family lipoprotein [Candidatus Delongbacteria bacterium]